MEKLLQIFGAEIPNIPGDQPGHGDVVNQKDPV